MPDLDLQDILAPSKAASESEEASSEKQKEDDNSSAGNDLGGLAGLLDTKAGPKEKILDSYDNIEIVDASKELYIYRVKLPNLTSTDKAVIASIQKIATKLIDSRTESADARVRKESIREKVYDMITKTSSIKTTESKMKAYADIVSREMGGFGLIDYLLDDELLEEVMVVPPQRDVYVYHRKHGMLMTNITIESDKYLTNVIERIARDVSRRIDTNTPLLDARLPSGDRVNATLNPASVDGPTLTIRRFRENPYSIIDMINYGTLDPHTAAFLWMCAEGFQAYPCNILVSGGTSSGKTTLLNCISMFIRPTERVVTIEDTAELKLPIKHWVRLETRPPSIEGTGEISMDVLLKNALRMRPDRILVGEVRHSEAFTLFTAMNTGHQGSMGTIHANSTDETLVRLTSPPMSVPEQMATALNIVVVLNRINMPKLGMVRKVTEIAEITGKDKPEAHILYQWNAEKDTFDKVDSNSNIKAKIRKFSGMSAQALEKELNMREALLAEAAKKKISSLKSFSIFVNKYYEAMDK
jgi:flagellar protein FlaI